MNQPYSILGNATVIFDGLATEAIEPGVVVQYKTGVGAGINLQNVAGAGQYGAGIAKLYPSDPRTDGNTAFQIGEAVPVVVGPCAARTGGAFSAGNELTTDAQGRLVARVDPATEAMVARAIEDSAGADLYVNIQFIASSNIN